MIANRFLVTSNGNVRHCLIFFKSVVEVNEDLSSPGFEKTRSLQLLVVIWASAESFSAL